MGDQLLLHLKLLTSVNNIVVECSRIRLAEDNQTMLLQWWATTVSHLLSRTVGVVDGEIKVTSTCLGTMIIVDFTVTLLLFLWLVKTLIQIQLIDRTLYLLRIQTLTLLMDLTLILI